MLPEQDMGGHAAGTHYACKTIPKIPKRGKGTPRYLLKLQTEVDAMVQLGPSLDAVYLKVSVQSSSSACTHRRKTCSAVVPWHRLRSGHCMVVACSVHQSRVEQLRRPRKRGLCTSGGGACGLLRHFAESPEVSVAGIEHALLCRASLRMMRASTWSWSCALVVASLTA